MIPITKPTLGEEEANASREAILSGWVTQGPRVQEFEESFAHYVGARHACAVSSCTSALHIALLAVGVRPGDVVITVSHSFIATANAIRYCGADPAFVDIDPRTYNMDPAALQRFLSEDCKKRDGLWFYGGPGGGATQSGRVAAVLAVHQLGLPCDLARILEVARSFGLPVVEDAACAAGSEWSSDDGRTWARIGRPHGDIACFSFHPRKIITTGEGGMLTTENADLDRTFRLLRQHGMSVPDTVRHGSASVVFERYVMTAFNYRMTDFQAAVGLAQLKRLPDIVARRRALALRYAERLADIPGIVPPAEPAGYRSNWQSYCVRLPDRCSQREVMQFLLDRGVATRRGVMCIHREEPYADAGERWSLPESERMQDYGVILPLYPQLTEEDQDHVVETLRSACRLGD